MRLRLLASAAIAATVIAASAAGTAAAQTPGTINWDLYGIPHIFAPDVPTAVRGMGYAHMENHAETVLNIWAVARGRSAEYFGAGAGNANVASDIFVRTVGIPARASLWVANSSTEQLQLLQEFCNGLNEYAAKNPSDTMSGLRPLLPVTLQDLAAGAQYTIWYNFLPQQDNDPALQAAWQSGGLAAANALARSFTPTGSNAWALGPQITADKHAILMGNPHLPWGVNQPAPGLQIYQWMEDHLIIGDPQNPTINADGVTFPNAAFLGIAFTDYLGWSHTNNTIKNADLYQLTLDATGTKYLFGGGYVPLSHRTDSIKILQPNGTFTTQSFDIWASVHGPVVAFSNDHKYALALRVPIYNSNEIVTQYWHMLEAQTLSQFETANMMLQMPFFNVTYADRDGHILHVFGGQQPVRQPGTTYGQIDGILDGTDPKQLWTATLPWTKLPQATDPAGHFIANSNNPPWTSAASSPTQLNGINPANYPTYIAPNFMDFRPQHGALFLQSSTSFSVADVIAGKMSTHMLLADRVLPDLIAAANQVGDATAKQAAALLGQWDQGYDVLSNTYGTADASSVGALLFETWWNLVVAAVTAPGSTLQADTTDNFYSPHPAFRIPWDRNNPVTTPVGLAQAAQLVPYLDQAVAQMQTNYGLGINGAWGAGHRTVLVYRSGPTQNLAGLAANDAQSGADDPFGPIRVTNPFYYAAFKTNLTYGGDGWVQVVDFPPPGQGGSTAYVLLGYGNSSRPNSPHITDQLPYFDAKQLRVAPRTAAQVQAVTVRTETY